MIAKDIKVIPCDQRKPGIGAMRLYAADLWKDTLADFPTLLMTF